MIPKVFIVLSLYYLGDNFYVAHLPSFSYICYNGDKTQYRGMEFLPTRKSKSSPSFYNVMW